MLARRVLSAFLTVVLLATSGTMAVARGHMAADATLHVLCLSGKPQVVAVGPDGAPVEDQPVCPDCVMGALLAADSLSAAPRVTLAAKATPPLPPTAPLLPRRIGEAPLARAPPLLV